MVWNLGAATGLGPLPGTDPIAAAALIAGELPELPFLAELPARGVGADPIGRTAGLLVDIFAEVVPSGWRISHRPSREMTRAKDFMAWDLDALAENYSGAPQLKLQVCGPWTLAAEIELTSGNRIVTDHGAIRDLAQSLAEGVTEHLGQVQRCLPGTSLLLQVNEPSLTQVLTGSLATASGFGTVRAIDRQVAAQVLRDFAARFAGITLIGAGAPATAHAAVNPDQASAVLTAAQILVDAGCAALTWDFTGVAQSAAALDFIGAGIESGLVLLAGLIPTVAPDGPKRSLAEWLRPLTDAMRILGFADSIIAGQVVITPAGSLESATPEWAQGALTLTREVARRLAEPLTDLPSAR